MQRVIVSTSTSCLDNFKIPNNVRMLRMHIHLNHQDFTDGVDITSAQLANWLIEHPKSAPTSSAPSEYELIDFFYGLVKQDIKEVFVVCVSSKLSETYRRIYNLLDFFAGRLHIHLFDSKSVSYSEGLLALEASKLLDQGASFETIEQHLNFMQKNTSVLFVLNELDGLVRTKRLSMPAGFIGNLLKVKPILQMSQTGEVVVYEKIRHIYNALDRMCEVVIKMVSGKKTFVYLMSSGGNELAEYVLKKLADAGIVNVPLVPIATVSVVSLGPKGIGIGVLMNH